VQTRARRDGLAAFRLAGVDAAFTAHAPIRLTLDPVRAEVLGQEEDGNPIFTRAAYGSGQLYFLSVPIETYLANLPGGFHGREGQPPWWRIYRTIGEPFMAQRAVRKTDPIVGLTEHPLDDGRRIVIAINYSPEPREAALEIAKPWTVEEAWYGVAPVDGSQGWQLRLAPSDAAVFTVAKR